MRLALSALVIAAALSSAPAHSAAQQPGEHQHPPATGPATGGAGPHGGMGGMHGGMPMGGCPFMSEERLESLKRDLDITAAQTPRWNAFADAVRTNRRAMDQMGQMGRMGLGPGGASPQNAVPLPERLDMHERMMTQHLEALRRLKAALLPLYASLTPAQKAKADAMCAHGQAPKGG